MINPHSIQKKKELGAYYTPPELSKVLTDWSITDAEQLILEPSFGGCGFLNSCITRLKELGNTQPKNNLFGVDIDDHAFKILDDMFKNSSPNNKKFIKSDFIAVNPADFEVDGFDVIIGNPPYVSMHNMTDKQRESCSNILKKSSFSSETMGRNASLWAFFLLHSLAFLKSGGKTCWVLPSSLLHADYAKKLLEIYSSVFETINIIKLTERFFISEGAQEISVVLAASNFNKEQQHKGSIKYSFAENVTELHNSLQEANTASGSISSNYKFDLLPRSIHLNYQDFIDTNKSISMGEIADIKIGLVSGANNFFLLDKETMSEKSIAIEATMPIVSRFSYLRGVRHNKKRHSALIDNGIKASLLTPTEKQVAESDSLQIYLSNFDEKAKTENRTFKKRVNWYEPNYGIDSLIPDAFLTYMIHRGPRLVLNQAKVNCTNSVHKVFFKKKGIRFKEQIAITISLLSTFSQFSAEIYGRAYSSGVLKIEPTSAKKIRLLINDYIIENLSLCIKDIEYLITKENFPEIRHYVDKVLINSGLISESQNKLFEEGLKILRSDRYRGVKTYNE